MVGTTGAERRDGRADDNLQEHGNGDEDVAGLVAEAGRALVGDNEGVDAAVFA